MLGTVYISIWDGGNSQTWGVDDNDEYVELLLSIVIPVARLTSYLYENYFFLINCTKF